MENPTRYRVIASRRVAAPAARVYDIIADYRVGHPSILPRAFRNLQVDDGRARRGHAVSGIGLRAAVWTQGDSCEGVVTRAAAGTLWLRRKSNLDPADGWTTFHRGRAARTDGEAVL
jgi:hypothetical protein